jgi:EmrB/QacA subfamily drug resistance transporter
MLKHGIARPDRSGAKMVAALIVILTASVMVVLDATIVNIALRPIGTELHASSGPVVWVATSYFLAVCAAQPATGWLVARMGHKTVFLCSLATFTAASAGCAASPTLPVLIGCRVVQGLGGGILLPVGMAALIELSPKDRPGRTMAIWGIAGMMTPAVGPTVGGIIVASLSWHWLFLVNVPIGLAAITIGIRCLPSIGHREHRPFDSVGLLLGSGGLTLTVLGLSEGNAWGWWSAPTMVALALGAAGLGGFARHIRGSPTPLLDPRVFAEREFRLAMGILLFVTGAQYGRLIFIPLQLESIRGYSPLQVGLLLAPPALFGAGSTWVGGLVADRIGVRQPILIGCVAIFLALIFFAHLTLTTPIGWILTLLTIQSIGMGLVNAPAVVAGLRRLPAGLLAQGTSVRSLTSQVSGALAVAVLGAIVVTASGTDPSPAQAQAAYNDAFLAASIGLAVSILMATRLPRNSRQDRTAQTSPLPSR